MNLTLTIIYINNPRRNIEMIQLSEHFNYKKLLKFTFPTIIMMIFTSIYGIVDGIFVSNVVGSDSFAAVNLIMPLIMLVGSIGFMIGTGGSALVSKTLGENKSKQANEYFSMLIYFLTGFGVVISIIGFVLIRPMAELLGADAKIIEDCVTYGKVLMIMMVPFLLQNAFQSFLVVAEKPAFGLSISIMAGITNMTLDFLFIYALKGGVFGAALATGISQIIGCVVPIIYFLKRDSKPLRLVKCRLNGRALCKSCLNGSSEMLTNLSMSLVNMLYNMQLIKFIGSDGIVAYGIIMYVSFIFVGTYLGYSIGVAPIIGYHYGAGNTSELKNLLKKSLILTATAAIVLTALAEFLAPMLGRIFVSYDKNLLTMTIHAIRLFSLAYIIQGFNIFASSFFTALNNGLVSAIISFMRTLVFQLIMIFLLPNIIGIDGIWLSVVAAEVLSLIISAFYFIKNRKKYHYI